MPWSSETARGRNTFFATAPTASPDPDVPPPDWLTGNALDHWHRTAPPLIASGRLRSTTSETFGVLCQLATDCVRLAAEVDAEGMIVETPRGTKPNPKARLLRDARRDLLAYSKSFGLDAASNARLPNAPAEPSAPTDPLEAYILSKGA